MSCAFGDRHCTLPPPQTEPCVWVGPHDGKWIKVVDREEVEPGAPVPCPPAGAPEDHVDSIVFVAIAAFRDSLCATTLQGIFERAERPGRIRVAIVQQNKEEDEDCYETYCARARAAKGLDPDAPCPYGDQVQIKRFSSDEAKGPTWARAQDADMLMDDAEFCLRTDSHMTFSTHWDTKQIAQWYGARNEYAVLSTYVADSNQINEDGSEKNINNVWEVPHLCSILWQDGHVRNMQAKAARLLERPKLTTLWAAGLSFSKCHAERAVPYDPHTPYIFWGEEFSRTARFWTRGYDIYTPPRTIVAHDYKHTQGDPTHYKWNGKGGPRIRQNATILNMRDAANRRIWTLLEMPGGDTSPEAKAQLGKYGLGDVRSLDQLINFTGIYLRERKIGPNRCGNIDWVPWECAAHAPAHAAPKPLAPPHAVVAPKPPLAPPAAATAAAAAPPLGGQQDAFNFDPTAWAAAFEQQREHAMKLEQERAAREAGRHHHHGEEDNWADHLPDGVVGDIERDIIKAEKFVEEELVSFEQMAAQRAIKSVMHHKGGGHGHDHHGPDSALPDRRKLDPADFQAKPENGEPIPPATILVGLVCLWTFVKAFGWVFRGKSQRKALGLPLTKAV